MISTNLSVGRAALPLFISVISGGISTTTLAKSNEDNFSSSALTASCDWAGKKVELPNLRHLRVPSSPWQVQAGELTALVRQVDIVNDEENLYFIMQLKVAFKIPAKGWRLTAVTSADPDVQVAASGREADLSVIVPYSSDVSCREGQAEVRAPIILDVTYTLNGKVRRRPIEVDYKATVGDIVSFSDDTSRAEAGARLVEKYREAPEITRLIGKVNPIARGGWAEEIALLRQTLGDQNIKYVLDPSTASTGFTAAAPYFLSPTETFRYGGDCEDWALVIGAYLTLRGFTASFAMTPDHAWIIVEENKQNISIDNNNLRGLSPVYLPGEATGVAPIKAPR